MPRLSPQLQLEEFSVNQLWQPQVGNSRIVSRLINAFVPDRSKTDIIIRYASPRGSVSRCTLYEMRKWIKDNAATCSVVEPTPIAENKPTEAEQEAEKITAPPILTDVVYKEPEIFSPRPFNSVFSTDDTTMLFIDGPYLHFMEKALQSVVDFRAMLEYFHQTNLVHANYYIDLPDTEEYSAVRRLTDWLSYNGYIVKQETSQEYIDGNNKLYTSGNQAMRIAVDMLCLDKRVEQIIFIASSKCYVPLIRAVKARGFVVTMIGLQKTMSDELRREADNYVDFKEIIGNFLRRRIPQQTVSVK